MPERYERIEAFVYHDGVIYILDYTFKGTCNYCGRLPDNPATTEGELWECQQLLKTPCCRKMVCMRCMEWIFELNHDNLYTCPFRPHGCRELWTHFPVWKDEHDERHLRGILVTSDHYTEGYSMEDGGGYEVFVHHLPAPGEQMTD